MKTTYIITGKVKSGKSSRLYDWACNQSEVTGILSLIIESKKHLYSISNKKNKCLETTDKNAISVGRYLFDPNVFSWAQKQLSHEFSLAKNYLIIDEIGYLELNGEGLEPTLSEIIKETNIRDDVTLLLVVRESLVNQVIDNYKLHNYNIINNINTLK